MWQPVANHSGEVELLYVTFTLLRGMSGPRLEPLHKNKLAQ